MALSFLTSSGNASSVKYFEIRYTAIPFPASSFQIVKSIWLVTNLSRLCRLEESNLILRGNGDEASSALLRGMLVLCLSEPLKVQDIHMRLRGESRIGLVRFTIGSILAI